LFLVFDLRQRRGITYVFEGTEGAGFHCGSVPRGLTVRKSDIIIKHYGYVEYRDRLRKFKFYTKNDPSTDYTHICPEWGAELPVIQWHENMTWQQIMAEIQKLRNEPIKA